MSVTVVSLCNDVARDLNLIMDGESLSAPDGATVLRHLTRLLNLWNAERAPIYALVRSSFTCTPSLLPHTIGPTGATFTLSQRPVKIESAQVVVGDTRTDIWIRDAKWWQALTLPDTEATYPSELFYNPVWPNGEIYFYPVPDAATTVELVTRLVLDDTLALTDSLDLPPGYLSAVTLTLMESIAQPFSVPVSPVTVQLARLARARIFANNDEVPRLVTREAGMPG